MPTLKSSRVAEGQVATAAQYNNLRADLLDSTGHDHSTGYGGEVNHGDLGDGVIITPTNTYVSHAKLNKHVQGDGASADPDATGGNKGVHGLHADVYVAGSASSQKVVQTGNGTTTGLSGTEQTMWVDFPVHFSSFPKVFVVSRDKAPLASGVRNVQPHGFTAAFYRADMSETDYITFDWIAVGGITA